ncbi:hypothetical protein [Streptomyces sp. NPDC001750]|uniref:hypothetical protein n=1 Tax=Streptomyces sp. NPDC001750 TaxID=3364607 RepID=UPI0036955F26
MSDRDRLRLDNLTSADLDQLDENDHPAGEKYPCRLGVFCDTCVTTFEGDFIVTDTMTKAERLAVVRDHVRAELGWQCDRSGDYCPEHKAQNDACPGTGEYGHGLTGTTVHVGCCPASR